MKTAFIGHRHISVKDIEKRLTNAVIGMIESGCTKYTVGTRGAFDKLSLSVCRTMKKRYESLEIEVVLTSLHQLKREIEFDPIFGKTVYERYGDVKTVIYDLEGVHFKNQITVSNRKMIDECDTLICYVDEKVKRSGAKSAMLYARRRGLNIINLYDENDEVELKLRMQEFEKNLKIR